MQRIGWLKNSFLSAKSNFNKSYGYDLSIARSFTYLSDSSGSNGNDDTSNSGSNGDGKNSSSKKPNTGLIRRKYGIRFNSNSVPNSSDSDDGSDVVDIANKISDIALVQVPKPNDSLILPSNGRPIFPGFRQSMIINNERLFKAISAIMDDSVYLSVFHTQRTDDELDDIDTEVDISDLSKVGTFCQVLALTPVYAPEQPYGQGKSRRPRRSSLEELRQEAESSDFVEGKRAPTGYRLEIEGHRRVQLESISGNRVPMFGQIKHLQDDSHPGSDEDVKAHINEILSSLKQIMSISQFHAEQIHISYARFARRDAGAICDFAATMSHGTPLDLQDILQELNIGDRLQKVLYLLKKDIKMFEVQREISSQVEKKVNETQRKHYLRQQLKEIQEELGYNKDDKRVLRENFEKKLAELIKVGIETGNELPEHAHKVIEEELMKLSTLDQDSSEFNYSRRYLEWLLNVPWTFFSHDNYDLLKANEILERDHYGLEDIKERIMEYIAVGNLKGEIKGKILLLVGPPGVGKTSIGKSIASALGREFFRFSVGGLSDVSEIKGHRRTYVGAMPGKIIQCLKQTKTMNPLILIDEIDKLSTGYRGDPASALLELLDPSQNSSFVDHYLDVPVDVSKVLFVCTANMTDTIPDPLLDRMEVLRLSGYDLPEKVAIAKDYLVPRAKKESGLVKEGEETDTLDNTVDVDVNISEPALEFLSRWYCREAGVRKLQQIIERIYRKVAFQMVKRKSKIDIPRINPSKKIREELNLPETGDYSIMEEDLENLVGKQVFQKDKMYEENIPPGVVMGLAWTSHGGSSLYIETTNVKSSSSSAGEKKSKPKDKLVITGQLGDVMKESSVISLTNAKHILNEIDPENNFFEENEIHLHVPEGATPKDGPSAGITMTTALLSLASGKEVSPNLAMTGEISLTGMVLPVGGIKEKIIAARRANVTLVLLPDGNRKDVDELPDYLQQDLQIEFVKTYQDVYKLVFN